MWYLRASWCVRRTHLGEPLQRKVACARCDVLRIEEITQGEEYIEFRSAARQCKTASPVESASKQRQFYVWFRSLLADIYVQKDKKAVISLIYVGAQLGNRIRSSDSGECYCRARVCGCCKHAAAVCIYVRKDNEENYTTRPLQ